MAASGSLPKKIQIPAGKAQAPFAMLRKRADFLRLAKGTKAVRPGLVLQSAPHPSEADPQVIRAGFTVTKKIGNAVIRNRAKRRLRAIARAILPLYGVAGYDYVLIGRDATVARPFDLLLQDLTTALHSLHRARKQNATDRPCP